MSRYIIVALVLAASPGAAQVMVSGPAGCGLVAGQADGGVFHVVDEAHMVFDFAVIEAVEHHCAFEPAFSTSLEAGVVQTRIGYCMDPGPFITPGVFTLMDRGDGTAQLDASFLSEPYIFEICPGP